MSLEALLEQLIDQYRELCINLQKLNRELLEENFALMMERKRLTDCIIHQNTELPKEEDTPTPWPFESPRHGSFLDYPRRCKAITKSRGIQCCNGAKAGSLFCRHHQAAELQTLEQIVKEQTGESE